MWFKSLAAVLAAATCVQALPGLGNSTTSYNGTIHHSTPQESGDCDGDHDSHEIHEIQEVHPPVHDQGFEVVILYAVPEKGCTAQPTHCDARPAIEAIASPKEGIYDDFKAHKAEQTGTFSHHGPMATLTPNVHWDWDTKDVGNVIPIPAKEGSHMYYDVKVQFSPGLAAIVSNMFI